MLAGLRTGEPAREGGVNLQTIRFYEREGTPAQTVRVLVRVANLSVATVMRVQFIRRAQVIGFSLAEIRHLLAIRVDASRDCSHVRQLALDKIADVTANIQTLERMRNVLTKLAEACPGTGPASECPILESVETEEKRDSSAGDPDAAAPCCHVRLARWPTGWCADYGADSKSAGAMRQRRLNRG